MSLAFTFPGQGSQSVGMLARLAADHRQVEETFAEARHPETGAKLFEDVFPVAERYGCDPVHESLPDLIAIPMPGYHTRTKFNAGGALLASDPSLPGTHRREGVLLLDAPGVRPGERPAADLSDVAPTLLALLGHRPSSSLPPLPSSPPSSTVYAISRSSVEIMSRSTYFEPLTASIDQPISGLPPSFSWRRGWSCSSS